ncbi:hypothetical protein WJX79_004650 [Trebouxia sp. C0005]
MEISKASTEYCPQVEICFDLFQDLPLEPCLQQSASCSDDCLAQKRVLRAQQSFGQFDVLGPRAMRARRQSSNDDGQPGHEPKRLFVVKHPGGDAHLAFREDEELKPYKKKSQASLYSATLDDDSFTIPAWKHDTFEQQMSSHQCQDAMSGYTVQQANHKDDGDLHTHPPGHGLADGALNEVAPLYSLHAATRPTVADTASQTSPR